MEIYEYILLWALLLAVRIIQYVVIHPLFIFGTIIMIYTGWNSRWISIFVLGSFAINPCLFYGKENFKPVAGFVKKWIQYQQRIMYEIAELLTWWKEKKRPIGTRDPKGWELVSAMELWPWRPFQVFHPVFVCDFNKLDDPFWPNNISAIHYIEIRANMVEDKYQLILWQISMFDGGQKKIVQSDFGRPIYCQLCHAYHYAVRTFQSAGVIIHSSLTGGPFIHDTRYGRTEHFDQNEFGWPGSLKIVMMSCIGRLRKANGSVEGWRVRTLTAETVLIDEWPQRFRVRLKNTVWDLRQNRGYKISQEEIDCGNSINDNLDKIRFRLNGMFGVHVQPWQHSNFPVIKDGPTILYDAKSNKYVYYANLDQLSQCDPMCKAYVETSKSKNRYGRCFMPIWINDHEHIVNRFDASDGKIYRREIKPASMKYIAAKKMFRSSPGLPYKMTAKQFREKTGLDQMEAHFTR